MKKTMNSTLTNILAAALGSLLFLAACALPTEQEQNRKTAVQGPVALQVSLGGSSRAERFLGTFDEIERLALDVDRTFDGRRVVEDFTLTRQNGVWKGTLNNLIVSFEYSITGHAYKTADNGSLVEIFRGSTITVIDSDNISLALRMAPMLDERELSIPRITKINRPFQMEKNTSDSIRISVTNSDQEPVHYRFRSIDEQTGVPLSGSLGGAFNPATGTQSDNGSGYSEIATTYTAPDNISVQHLQVRVSNDLEIGVSSTFNTYITGPIDSQSIVDTNPVIESISAERTGDSSLQWTLLVSDDENFSRMVAHWEYIGGGMRIFDSSVYTELTDENRANVGLGHIQTVMQGYRDSDDGILRVTVCEDMPGHAGTCVNGAEGSTTVSMELIAYAYQQPILCDGVNCSSGGTLVAENNRIPRFLTMDASAAGVQNEYAPEVGNQYIPVYEAFQSQIYYSGDGLTWKEGPENSVIELRQTPEITPMPTAVLYDGNRVLAVDTTSSGRGDNASLVYEQSGSGWSHIGEIPDNLTFVTTFDNGSGSYTITEELNPLTHLAYGNGTYLGVAAMEGQLNNWCYGGSNNYWGQWGSCSGNSPARSQTIVSSDGVNWNLGTRSITIVVDNGSGPPDNITVIPLDVVFDGSHFVAVTDNVSGETPVVKSSDGINWSELGIISGGDRDNGTFTWDVPNDNGTSDTSDDTLDNVTLGNINHWLYGNGKFLAVAANHNTNPNAYYRSYSYWSNSQSSYVSNKWWCSRDFQGNYLGYDDAYDECQAYDQMQTLVSDNGSSWTPQNGNPNVTFPVDNGTHVDNVTVIPDAMVFHNGKFIGMKSNNDNVSATLIQSTDGLTWDLIDSAQMPTDNVSKLLSAFGKLIHIDLREGNNAYCQHPSTGSWGYWEECSNSTHDQMQAQQSSDDGLTWSSMNDNVKVSLDYTTKELLMPEQIVFGNNRYLAVLDSTVESGQDTLTAVGSSEDGLSWGYWGSIDPGLLDQNLDGISHLSYGGGRYVAVAAAKGGMKYMYIPALNSWNNVYVDDLMQTLVSDDGAAWTLGNDEVEVNLPSGGVGPIIPTAMTYGNSEFLATDGSVVISSSDGVTWSYTGSFNEALPVTGLSYGSGKYVALAHSSGSGSTRSYSNWSNRLGRNVIPSENLRWCNYDANGNYLGYEDVYDECQEVNEIWTSTDGSSWQQETFSYTQEGYTTDNGTVIPSSVENPSAQLLVSGGGSFYAYDNKTAMTSTNGYNWYRDDLHGEDNASEFIMPVFSDNSSTLSFGDVLDNLTSSSTTSPLRVVRIGPSGDPESTSYSYVQRYRAKKVFVTFNRPVTISQNGSYYSYSGTESCENFDVQYYRTSNESQCYRWTGSPQGWGDNVTVGSTVFNRTWVFDTGQDPEYYQHRIRVKSSPTLVDQSGNSLDEDFVSGQIYLQ